MLLNKYSVKEFLSSTIQQHDHWRILEKILLTAKEQPQNYSQFMRIINGVPHLCAHGYALRALGMSTKDIRYPILSKNAPNSVLSKLGFTRDERKKFRRCPEVGCRYAAILYYLISHLNNDHKFSLPVIGKLIPAIRDDTRKPLNPILLIRRIIKK